MSMSTVGIYAHLTSLDDSGGGVEVFSSRLATQLAEIGHHVVVHALAAPLRAPTDELAAPTQHPRVSVFSPRSGPGFEGCVRENAEVTRRYGEHIIFAIGIRDPHVYQVALQAGQQTGVPVVSFIYNSLNERIFRAQLASRSPYLLGLASEAEQHEFLRQTREDLRAILHDSDVVVVPTDYMRGEMAGVLEDKLATNIVVNFHGVPTREFVFEERAQYRGRLLHLSRMMYPQALSKNYLWSCRLISRLIAEDPVGNHRLAMVGAGRGDDMIRGFVEDLEVQHVVDFAGSVPKSGLARVYSEADILLCPSMMESSCQSLLEALLSGCIPVVLDFGGAAEVMRRLGLSHLLVSPEEVDEGPFRTVVPRMDHALEVLRAVRDDWAGVVATVRTAAAAASQELSVEATTAALVAEVRRRGLVSWTGA